VRISLFSLVTFLSVFTFCPQRHLAAAEKTKNERVVQNGMLVSLEYAVKGTDGKLMDTNKGREPLKYVHGQKMMIPGVEKELAGMKVGGEKHITVKPEDAYGLVDPKAFQEVPKEKIPAKALKVGIMLAAKTPDGTVVPSRVHEIKEKTVVMDMNHPMAGKTLVFDLKILDIQPAPPPSLPPAQPNAPAKPGVPAQPSKPAEPAKK
jgi:FKBP-type peptidyl-prolyl cis-trans isomerase SlyD